MKKLLFSLMLIVACSASAQDIEQFISDLSKIEGIEHQRVDREMLGEQLKQAIEADPSGQLEAQLPPFLKKIDLIEVLVSEESPVDVRVKFASKLSNLTVGEEYETLLKVKEESSIVHIVMKKGKEKGLSSVYVLVVDDNEIVAVRFSGDFTEEDIKNIVEDQKKNIG